MLTVVLEYTGYRSIKISQSGDCTIKLAALLTVLLDVSIAKSF